MGLSHALYEEMTFDESGVTSRDWRSYPILTMADLPEIKAWDGLAWTARPCPGKTGAVSRR